MGGWFVLSAIFMVAVFGLFFTFTERRTWPEQKTELAATDMRLLPSISTVWCEALSLHSDHPFIAYQVSQGPFINPSHLSRQKVSFNIRVGGGRSSNSVKLKYYLLPSSVIDVRACALLPGARVLVLKGGEEENMEYFIQNEAEDSESSEENAEDIDCRKRTLSSLISSREIPVTEESLSCDESLIRINISEADFYTFLLLNSRRINEIDFRMILDRARYSIHRKGQAFDMCSLATSCTIGLSFASSDRALVWIPEETHSGRSSFIVRSQCRPRLAVFAILSVFLPLLVFVLVAFVVRADKERIVRIYNNGLRGNRVAAPLLDDGVEVRERNAPEGSGRIDNEQPPPYDPPPPYACVRLGSDKQCT